MRTAGELPRRAGCHIQDEGMQPPIIVEMRITFGRVRLIEIARDHDGVPACLRSLRPRLCRYVRDLLAVRRPGDRLASGWQRAVRSFHRGEKPLPGAIR